MRANIFRSNQIGHQEIEPETSFEQIGGVSPFECIVKRFRCDRRQMDISVINFKVDRVPQFRTSVMSTLLNSRFSPFNRYRVHKTHKLKTVNRRKVPVNPSKEKIAYR